MKENEVKLKDDFIKKLKYIQTEYSQITQDIGLIELEKINLKQRKLELENTYNDIKNMEETFLKDMYDEYGEGHVNIKENTYIKKV